MAHPANRSIDFAPAWLKLPEQNQEKKPDFPSSNRPFLSKKSGGNAVNLKDYHQTNNQNHLHHQQDFSNHSLNQHQQPSGRFSRPFLNNYNSRPSNQVNQLHRSQSTSSYSDNGHKSVSQSSVSNPLEEDFPLLSSAPVLSPSHNSSTAKWRVKLTTADQQGNRQDGATKPGQTSEKLLLTSNMPGKVYRAQVRPVRRSNMIPINNGKNPSVKDDQNGHHDSAILSSSVEKEKRLLQEMGWKEDDDSEDDCIIPEQDPEQLQEIFMKAKAARERLLMKSKQSMKPTVTAAVLPNEDDLPSSSDNSDAE